MKPLATAKTVRDPHATGCVGHDHGQDVIAAAERRGYDKAVANLRDTAKRQAWLREYADRWAGYDGDVYADYLEATMDDTARAARRAEGSGT